MSKHIQIRPSQRRRGTGPRRASSDWEEGTEQRIGLQSLSCKGHACNAALRASIRDALEVPNDPQFGLVREMRWNQFPRACGCWVHATYGYAGVLSVLRCCCIIGTVRHYRWTTLLCSTRLELVSPGVWTGLSAVHAPSWAIPLVNPACSGPLQNPAPHATWNPVRALEGPAPQRSRRPILGPPARRLQAELDTARLPHSCRSRAGLRLSDSAAPNNFPSPVACRLSPVAPGHFKILCPPILFSTF
jgi:hypothetical protein